MKNFKFRNLLKPYFLIPICIIAFVLFDFAFWYLMPAKSLRIAVVDKTVPATAADNASYLGDVSNNYRKHIGIRKYGFKRLRNLKFFIRFPPHKLFGEGCRVFHSNEQMRQRPQDQTAFLCR